MRDGVDLRVTIPSISAADNTDEASGAVGSVSYASSDTGGDTYASSSCLFWVNPDSQAISAGAAWVSFVCDAVTNEGDSCSIDKGFISVKNCSGAGEEEEEEEE